MATPKVACSKIKIVLQQLEGLSLPPFPLRIHFRDTPGLQFVPSVADFSTQEVVEILTSPEWFRFCFVRNPYARLFSAYKSQVMDLSTPYTGLRESIRRQAGYPSREDDIPGHVGFGDFVRYIGEQPDSERDGHWKSQAGTIHAEAIAYDFVGRMETFSRDFTRLLDRFGAPAPLKATVAEAVNPTPNLPLAAAYDKDLADYVYQVFLDDFHAFGYDRNSWMVENYGRPGDAARR
jgi:hypothetical protein